MLGDSELDQLLVQDQYEAALVALGVDFSILRIKRFLIINGGGHSQSSLSSLLSIPRRTLGQRVRQCVEWGSLRVEGAGVYITDEGLQMFTMVHREASEISKGERRGFSHDIVDAVFALMPERCDRALAKSVSYRPLRKA